MNFPLSTCNALRNISDKLYVLRDTDKEDFFYSDGDAHEDYVRHALTSAKDLSSTSEELESYCKDWPSEYHLSRKRANILRAINLSGIDTALEVGSGCGAISRYLLEQGISLDSIEGSARRAHMTTLRCRDLDKLHVVNANFNSLQLPEKEYDAVFFIGVLEYARRFLPECAGDQEALTSMLGRAFSSLKEDGVVIIAIENRIGFKYLTGATEDHFGVADIGLFGYPSINSKLNTSKFGIRTYDKREWQKLLDQIPGIEYRFSYPFPDYKIADTVLSDNFTTDDRYSFNLAARTASRDYRAHWEPNLNEEIFWETAASAGAMDQYANSFLLVLSKSKPRVEAIVDKGFINFPNYKRKPEYRVSVFKPDNLDIVRRVPELSRNEALPTHFVEHCLEDEPFFQGPLLSNEWRKALILFREAFVFEELIKDFYQFLQKYQKESGRHQRAVDITPFNIILDKTGNYCVFDAEWLAFQSPPVNFIFFRAMLYYALIEKKYLSYFFEAYNLVTLADFIELCFKLTKQPLDIEEYIALEDKFQAQVLLPEKLVTTSDRLKTATRESDLQFYYPHIYWDPVNEEIFSECVISQQMILTNEKTTVTMILPAKSLGTKLIRFDAIDHQTSFDGGVFEVSSLKVVLSSSDQEDRLLLNLTTASAIAHHCTFVNFDTISIDRGIYAPTSNDPQLLAPVSYDSSYSESDSLTFSITYRLYRQEDIKHLLKEMSERMDPIASTGKNTWLQNRLARISNHGEN